MTGSVARRTHKAFLPIAQTLAEAYGSFHRVARRRHLFSLLLLSSLLVCSGFGLSNREVFRPAGTPSGLGHFDSRSPDVESENTKHSQTYTAQAFLAWDAGQGTLSSSKYLGGKPHTVKVFTSSSPVAAPVPRNFSTSLAPQIGGLSYTCGLNAMEDPARSHPSVHEEVVSVIDNVDVAPRLPIAGPESNDGVIASQVPDKSQNLPGNSSFNRRAFHQSDCDSNNAANILSDIRMRLRFATLFISARQLVSGFRAESPTLVSFAMAYLLGLALLVQFDTPWSAALLFEFLPLLVTLCGYDRTFALIEAGVSGASRTLWTGFTQTLYGATEHTSRIGGSGNDEMHQGQHAQPIWSRDCTWRVVVVLLAMGMQAKPSFSNLCSLFARIMVCDCVLFSTSSGATSHHRGEVSEKDASGLNKQMSQPAANCPFSTESKSLEPKFVHSDNQEERTASGRNTVASMVDRSFRLVRARQEDASGFLASWTHSVLDSSAAILALVCIENVIILRGGMVAVRAVTGFRGWILKTGTSQSKSGLGTAFHGRPSLDRASNTPKPVATLNRTFPGAHFEGKINGQATVAQQGHCLRQAARGQYQPPDSGSKPRSKQQVQGFLDQKRAHELLDDEIVDLSISGHLPGYALETTVKDCARAVKLRRAIVSRTRLTGGHTEGLEDSHLPYREYDWARVSGACCENVIGYMPVPVGVAGPITIDGKSFLVPMATTEGTLVASTSRGCKAVNAGGGAVTELTGDGMTRAPVVTFERLERAGVAKRWLDSDHGAAVMAKAFNSSSRFARLQSMKVVLAGTHLFIRFKASTGDAMGMNMVSKGAEKALEAMMRDGFHDMTIVSLSGNYCADKKPTAINWIEGRGKSVVAEAVIPHEIVKSALKTDVDHLVRLHQSKNMVGSAIAGSMGGFNAHAANMVAAVFLATGQDIAQVVESASCMTMMSNLGGALHISVSMPSVEVGTVGGGTVLEAQRAMLDLLGVRGPHTSEPGENARQLARVVAAVTLAGELSLCSALAAGHLVRSHMQHNRSTAPAQPNAST